MREEASKPPIEGNVTGLGGSVEFAVTLFESLTKCAVLAVDFNGNVVACNKAVNQIFGYTPQEIVGRKSIAALFPEDFTSSGKLPQIMKSLTRQETLSCAEDMVRKNGERFPAETQLIVTRDKSGTAIGFLGIVEDLSERKKIEEQLVFADRLVAVGQMVAGIAHDINNPLTSIIGFSQLLLEKDIPEDIREDVEIITSEAQRAASIVTNLTVFASRRRTDEKRVEDINGIIEKTVGIRAYEQRVNSIKTNARLAPDLPRVSVDYMKLQQCFLAIIINAERSMTQAHNGGILTIITRRAGDCIRILFADDGASIAGENLEHLFDAAATIAEADYGNRLGLSLCRRIITEHGGRVCAESRPGRGTSVIVELPCIAQG